MKKIISLIISVVISTVFINFPIVHAKQNIKIGDYVQMGTYYNAPILWRCVDIDENGPLMLSDKILCLKAFDAAGSNTIGSHGRGYRTCRQYSGSNYWADSNIRCWLNSNDKNIIWKCGNSPNDDNIYGGFSEKNSNYKNESGFKTNFTEKELNAIKKVNIYTFIQGDEYDDMTLYGSQFYKIANDISLIDTNIDDVYKESNEEEIFLLDITQLYNIYNNKDILGDDYCIGKVSPNIEQHLRRSVYFADGKYSYWLRTPNCNTNRNGSVDYYGGVEVGCIEPSGKIQTNRAYFEDGIRPAFYLDMSNANFAMGAGTEGNPYAIESITNGENITVPQNNPVFSQYEKKDITLKLGEEDYIAPFIDGIYSDISDNELNITNSNENVLEILRKEFSISDPVNPGDMCVATASAYVKALSPGTSTLTFYCSGKEMGKINVTVEAIIADTISDDTIMRATVLHNNKGYHLHKDSIPSPAERLNDEIKKSYQKSWASTYLFVNDMLGVLTLHFKDGKELNTKTYYETILADILENDSNGVWDKTYSVWKKGYGVYNDAIVQKIIGKTADIDKIKTSTFMKNNEDKKVLETIIDYSNEQGVLKDVTIKVDLLDKLSVSADLVGDFFDALDEMYAYSAVQQEKIDFLKELKQNTSNSALSQACDNLIADIKFAHENATLYFVSNFGKDATYDLFKFSSGIVAGVVLQYISTDTAGITPYVPGITEAKAILDGGQFIANNIINADDISKSILTVSAYTDILQETKNVVNKFENRFVSDSNIDNTLKFIGSADIFKSVLLQSYDVYIDYNKAVQKGNNRMEITGKLSKLLRGDLISFIKNMNKKDSSFDDNTSKAERMKQNLKDMDFYSDEFVDIAAYISKIESTTPSNWAKQYVDKAIETDLLPEYLRGNYQNNITRAEFCTLITRLIEIKKDDAIQEIVKKAPYNPQLFKDSYYSYVYYMACLGIVNGVNEDEFNPLGEITREQAATLLMRTAEYFGIDTNAQEYKNAGVSDWAKKGVNFVIQNNIMTGTDNGFEPQGKYTKEQAITTFVRFYDNLK